MSKYTLTHAVATAIGVAAVGYQTAVIWEMLEGVSTITKLGVPLATVSAALLPVLAEAANAQGERLKSFLLAVPVLALVMFVLPSGVSRLGEAQQSRRVTAETSQADVAKARADLAKADKLVSEAQAWAATECASGNGTKCKGVTYVLEQRQSHQKALAALTTAKPAAVSPWLPDWHPATLPIGLELALWACFFYGLGPIAKRHALTFERPLSDQEAEEVRKVLKLTKAEVVAMKAGGMKQHEIAAKLGVNQGRVSEVLSGKRHELALH